MNIDIASTKQIISTECINCQICVLSCPKDSCLQIKHGKKNTNPILAATMAFMIFFGGIFISKSTGTYNTLPEALPAEKTIPVDEIRGYMTLKEVSERTKIDLKALYKKLGIPDTVPSDIKFKELKNYVPGFSDEKAKELLKEK